MKKTTATSTVLAHVDPCRRGFLAKLLASGGAVAALPTMSTIALGGDDLGGVGKGPGAKGKGGKGKGDGPDPTRMAANMIRQFDKDGDNALNERELAAALTNLRQRRRSGEGQGRFGGGKGKGGPGSGSGKGKRGPIGGRGRGSRRGRGKGQGNV